MRAIAQTRVTHMRTATLHRHHIRTTTNEAHRHTHTHTHTHTHDTHARTHMHRPTHAHTHKKRGSGFMKIRPESASLLLQHAPVPPRPDAQQRCPQGGRARHPAEPCVVLTPCATAAAWVQKARNDGSDSESAEAESAGYQSTLAATRTHSRTHSRSGLMRNRGGFRNPSWF